MKFWEESAGQKIILGIVLLVAVAVIFITTSGSEETPKTLLPATGSGESNGNLVSEIRALEKETEEKVMNVLSTMEGVGKVEAAVTYTNGIRKEYARNQSESQKDSQERDREGGTRETVEITQNNPVVLSGEKPILIWEQRPELTGVLIVAEGAVKAQVRKDISLAVQTLLGVSAEKISVVPMAEAKQTMLELRL